MKSVWLTDWVAALDKIHRQVMRSADVDSLFIAHSARKYRCAYLLLDQSLSLIFSLFAQACIYMYFDQSLEVKYE